MDKLWPFDKLSISNIDSGVLSTFSGGYHFWVKGQVGTEEWWLSPDLEPLVMRRRESGEENISIVEITEYR